MADFCTEISKWTVGDGRQKKDKFDIHEKHSFSKSYSLYLSCLLDSFHTLFVATIAP